MAPTSNISSRHHLLLHVFVKSIHTAISHKHVLFAKLFLLKVGFNPKPRTSSIAILWGSTKLSQDWTHMVNTNLRFYTHSTYLDIKQYSTRSPSEQQACSIQISMRAHSIRQILPYCNTMSNNVVDQEFWFEGVCVWSSLMCVVISKMLTFCFERNF